MASYVSNRRTVQTYVLHHEAHFRVDMGEARAKLPAQSLQHFSFIQRHCSYHWLVFQLTEIGKHGHATPQRAGGEVRDLKDGRLLIGVVRIGPEKPNQVVPISMIVDDATPREDVAV